MKAIKSLLLGSTVGILPVGGTQAADLPVKAKAVEYVRICSPYGAGFFYIPGTDTCIKLGGYLHADLTANGAIYDGPFWNGEGAIRDRYANFYSGRSRVSLSFDTRTATEYGVVRTFGQADLQFSTFDSSSSIGFADKVSPSATNGALNNDTAVTATPRSKWCSSSSPASPSVSPPRRSPHRGMAIRPTTRRS